MKLIHDGTAPLATSELFRDLLGGLTDQPLILLLISAVFTALVRSSAAVIGLALSPAPSRLVPPLGAIPIIFGPHVRTPATAGPPRGGGGARRPPGPAAPRPPHK